MSCPRRKMLLQIFLLCKNNIISSKVDWVAEHVERDQNFATKSTVEFDDRFVVKVYQARLYDLKISLLGMNFGSGSMTIFGSFTKL